MEKIVEKLVRWLIAYCLANDFHLHRNPTMKPKEGENVKQPESTS